MASKIPIRPTAGKYQLSQNEMDCIVWQVLSGCKKERAYLAFVRPDLATSPMVLKKTSDQFFSMVDVRNFISNYLNTLDGVSDVEVEKIEKKSKEQRTAEAIEKFTDKVVDKMSGDLESVDEMDAIAKLADRVGVLADKEEVVEKPRRYIPARCNTDCKYRFWAEQVVKVGDAIDCCEYCRALAVAKEHGFIYDPTKLLDLPFTEIHRSQ